MKKITLLAFLFVFAISFAQTTVTHSTDPVTVLGGTTVACPTEPTNYQRTFDFNNQFGINGGFIINTVEFGVEISEASGTIPLRLAIIDNIDPSEDLDVDGVPDFSVIEELFLGDAPAGLADEGTVVSFTLPEPVTVPDGAILLVEFPEAVDGTIFRIGSNTGGETAPSYLFSVTCGFGSVDSFGFDNDYVINLIGDPVLGVEDNILADSVSIFPNPTNGDMNISFSRSLGEASIQFTSITGQIVMETSVDAIGTSTLNTSRLSSGIYFAQIATEDASTVIKFIKN